MRPVPTWFRPPECFYQDFAQSVARASFVQPERAVSSLERSQFQIWSLCEPPVVHLRLFSEPRPINGIALRDHSIEERRADVSFREITGEQLGFCAMFTLLTYVSLEAHLRLNLAIFSEPHVKVQLPRSSMGNPFFFVQHSSSPRHRSLSNVQRRLWGTGVCSYRNTIHLGWIPWKDKLVKDDPQARRGREEA